MRRFLLAITIIGIALGLASCGGGGGGGPNQLNPSGCTSMCV